jgi:hypothetical protein
VNFKFISLVFHNITCSHLKSLKYFETLFGVTVHSVENCAWHSLLSAQRFKTSAGQNHTTQNVAEKHASSTVEGGRRENRSKSVRSNISTVLYRKRISPNYIFRNSTNNNDWLWDHIMKLTILFSFLFQPIDSARVTSTIGREKIVRVYAEHCNSVNLRYLFKLF